MLVRGEGRIDWLTAHVDNDRIPTFKGQVVWKQTILCNGDLAQNDVVRTVGGQLRKINI